MCYQKEKSEWILNSPVVDQGWSSCLHTLEGHGSEVYSIAWSPDGSRLASASNDKTVKIWDPATGHCASTLEEHSGWGTLVALGNSIAWSPDGSRLASASHDKTVRIWDPATGQSVSTLDIHSPHFLQFDESTPNHLHTVLGTLDLGSTEPVPPSASRSILPEIYGFGLSDSSWVGWLEGASPSVQHPILGS